MVFEKTPGDRPIMIKVSVIIPFYNSQRYIKNCIEGILQQSYPREQYEILMIDNNSTDASAETVRQYPGIRLLSESKQGAYAARNRGLQEAKGDIIAFTDADCVPSHEWLHKIVTAIEQPGLNIVLGRRKFAGDSLLLSMLAAYDHEKHRYVFNSERKELYYGHTNNMAVKKKLFDELGPFVERARGGDTIFVRQSVNKYSCGVVRYCPKIQVLHMEIDTLGKLYRKFFIYGRSSRGFWRVVRVEPLTNRERLQVFQNVVQNRGYSWKESLILMGLLWTGLAFWSLGKISLIRGKKENVI